MSYVQSVLQQGEEIRYTAKLHWIEYFWGLFLLLLAIVLYVFAQSLNHPTGARIGGIVAAAMGLIGLAVLAYEWFEIWTTEIAVTNRRIIYKEGFIRRKTIEMHMDKVESVDVEQSILGRLLDFGQVDVRGIGTGFEPLKKVAAPLELRNHITGV